MSDGFTLGGFYFGPWETPSEMPFGGKQKINKHILIGGQRVIDAMGPDSGPYTWNGRARGPGAAGRMRALDAIRIAGQAVDLTWGAFYYSVIITDFAPIYMRENECKYSITVEVVDDPTADSASGGASSLDSMVGGDMSSAGGMAAQ